MKTLPHVFLAACLAALSCSAGAQTAATKSVAPAGAARAAPKAAAAPAGKAAPATPATSTAQAGKPAPGTPSTAQPASADAASAANANLGAADAAAARAAAPAVNAAVALAAGAGGTPQAGQQLAASGAPNGVAACIGCHGANGEGNAAAGFPRLAGLPQYYLVKQLASYANGTREHPIMSPIAKAMNAQQMRDAGAWYATLATPAAAPARTAAASLERGRTLAGSGDESKKVQACANCHGPNGVGQPPNYPALAGQHAGYLTAAMAAWKSGVRKTDVSMQMPAVARKLSEQDVAALSAFYAAQPAPRTAAQMINIAAGSSARPAVAAAPGAPGPKTAAAAQPQGTGTEQGAPLTGGNQGPGGGGGTKATQSPPKK
jgi:cytochrome c553